MDFILKIPGYVEDIILSSWTDTFLQILLRAFFFVLDILQDFSLTVLTGSVSEINASYRYVYIYRQNDADNPLFVNVSKTHLQIFIYKYSIQ